MTATDPTKTPAAPAAPVAPTTMAKETTPDSVEMARLAGKVAALEAQAAERDANQQRKDDVAAALKRLEGRPLGATPEQRFTDYHKAHGPAAFKAYVDSFAETFGTLPRVDAGSAGASLAATTTEVPEVAAAYQDSGTEAVERAVQFSREWSLQREQGFGSVPEDRYVALSMARWAKTKGIQLKTKAKAATA